MCVENVREAVVQHLLHTLNKECNKLCRKKPTTSHTSTSLFRTIPVSNLAGFKWKDMMSELEKDAPLLLNVWWHEMTPGTRSRLELPITQESVQLLQ